MDLKIVNDRTTTLVEQLVNVWERSVTETHLFLSAEEIEEIKKYVPQALCGVANLLIAVNENDLPVAFMGVENGMLEMIFVDPDERGKGLGKRLIQYGIEKYSINEVTVNEQNPQARGFYEHLGFQTYKRTEYDEQGQPYPLLYMRLGE